MVITNRKVLLVILFMLITISLLVGPTGYGFKHLTSVILWHSRIPRTVSLILAGTGLSLAGLLIQTVSNNRFAAPSTVGTVSSAKLGLVLSYLLFDQANSTGKLVMSFMSAIILTVAFFAIFNRLTIKEAWTVPLFGTIYGQLINGVGDAIAYRFNLSQNIASWLQGSFSMVQPGQFELLFLSLISVVLIYVFMNQLSIMQLGKDTSINLGVDYNKVWYLVLACVSLTTAVNVIVVGSLPFIGVIIPNIVRMYRGDLLKDNVVDVMLLGAIFVILCDIVARTLINPFEIPVAVIISLVGGITFIYLLLKGDFAS